MIRWLRIRWFRSRLAAARKERAAWQAWLQANAEHVCEDYFIVSHGDMWSVWRERGKRLKPACVIFPCRKLAVQYILTLVLKHSPISF